jgi:hypothetical protein
MQNTSAVTAAFQPDPVARLDGSRDIRKVGERAGHALEQLYQTQRQRLAFRRS